MPQELDPVPVESPSEEILLPPANEVFKNIPRQPAYDPHDHRNSIEVVDFDEYESLLDDRPQKFHPFQVDYREAEEVGVQCDRCIHFYQQVAGERRTTCEILRLDKDENIDPEYVCKFQSRDGVTYPYQEKVSGKGRSSKDDGGRRSGESENV